MFVKKRFVKYKNKRCAFDVEDRVSAAKSLIEKLQKSHCREIIEQTSRLCVAYVELANYNVDKFKGKNGGKNTQHEILFKTYRQVKACVAEC